MFCRMMDECLIKILKRNKAGLSAFTNLGRSIRIDQSRQVYPYWPIKAGLSALTNLKNKTNIWFWTNWYKIEKYNKWRFTIAYLESIVFYFYAKIRYGVYSIVRVISENVFLSHTIARIKKRVYHYVHTTILHGSFDLRFCCYFSGTKLIMHVHTLLITSLYIRPKIFNNFLNITLSSGECERIKHWYKQNHFLFCRAYHSDKCLFYDLYCFTRF